MKQLSQILATAETVAEFNTNNAWGFGGGYGKVYTFPKDIVIRKGTACYRHAPSHPFFTVSVKGERIIDVERCTPKALATLNTLIT